MMRLHVGPIPVSDSFCPQSAGWKQLREPAAWITMLLSLPIVFLAASWLGLIWFALWPSLAGLTFEAQSPMQPWATLIALPAGVLLLILIHELLHASATPQFGSSPATVLGFWPSLGAFYAHYDGEVSRNRFILVLLVPFTIISVVPLFLSAIIGWQSRIAALCSVLNALFSSADLLGAVLILAQVPSGARVRNQGWATWWRSGE